MTTVVNLTVTQPHEQLVQRIVQQVLTRLAAEQASAPTAAPHKPADIRPPLGHCTADGQPAASILPTPSLSAAEPLVSNPPHPPLTGFITAIQLEDALRAHGQAIIADDARFTPLAADLAKQHPATIRRVSAAALPTGSGALSTDTAFLAWSDGYCPAINASLNRLHRQLTRAAARPDPAGLAEVCQQLAGAVTARKLTGGVLFVRCRAAALVLVNRYTALRAAAANCTVALDDALATVGPNVLVVEYPRIKPAALDAVLDRFVHTTPKPPAALARLLAAPSPAHMGGL